MFPFQDYKIVRTVITGSNTTSLRTVYTTEYPCLMWCEILPGEVAGFNGEAKSCYFDVTYTGDRTITSRTFLFGSGNQSLPMPGVNGTVIGYCRQAGVPVIFNTTDDDYSGAVCIHILKLPDRSVATT